MKFPKTILIFKEELLLSIEKDQLSKGNQRYRQFLMLMPKVDVNIQIEGVLQVWEESINDYLVQKYCIEILKEIEPGKHFTLEGIFKRMIISWDLSSHGMVFWLVDSYGKDVFINFLLQFEKENRNDIMADKIKTMKYWLKGYTTEWKEYDHFGCYIWVKPKIT